MPIISVFFGIIIRMFYKEHEPAHFHAEHHGQHAKFDLAGDLLVGEIQSRTAVRLIREWALAHRTEVGGQLGEDERRQATRPDPSVGVV